MIKYLFFLVVAILGTMPIYAEEKRPIDKIQTSEGLSQLMDGVLLLDKIEKKLKKQSEFFKAVKNAKQLQKVNTSLAQIKGITRKISGNPIISNLNKAITYGNFAVEATNYATGLNDSELAELDVIVAGVNIAFSKLGFAGVAGSFVLDTSYGILNKFNKVLNDLNEQRLSDIDHTSQVFLYATDIRNSGSHDIDKDGINESGLILDIIQSSEIQGKSNAEIISSVEIRYQKSIDNFVSIIEIYNNQYQEKLEKLNNRLICEFTCKENKRAYASIIASNNNYIKNMKRAKSDFFDNSKYLSLINTYIDNARAVHDDLSVELAQYKQIPLLSDTQNASIYEDIPPPPVFAGNEEEENQYTPPPTFANNEEEENQYTPPPTFANNEEEENQYTPPPTFANNEEEENQYTPPQEEINPDVEDALTDNIKEGTENNSNQEVVGAALTAFSSDLTNKGNDEIIPHGYTAKISVRDTPDYGKVPTHYNLQSIIGDKTIKMQVWHSNTSHEIIETKPVQVDTRDSNRQYSYLGWGEWASGKTFIRHGEQIIMEHSHYVVGIPTDAYADRGKYPSGSATYNGRIQGSYANGSVREGNSIGGAITLNANFDTNKMSGQIDATRNENPWATATFNELEIRRSSQDSGSAFVGSMNVTGGSAGSISGTFYGPEAQEVGGNFDIEKDGGRASGIYKAQR